MEKRFDSFDELMREAAREESSTVDFAALLENVREAKAEETRRARYRLRLASSAAALVVVLGGALVWAQGNGYMGAKSAVPRSAAYTLGDTEAAAPAAPAAPAQPAPEPAEASNGDGANGSDGLLSSAGITGAGGAFSPVPETELVYIGESANSTLVPNSLPASVTDVQPNDDGGVTYTLAEGEFTVWRLELDDTIEIGKALFSISDTAVDIIYRVNADTLICVYSEELSREALEEMLKGW